MANRYAQVFAIIKKKGLEKESLDELVNSLFGAESLKDLTDKQVGELVRTLNSSTSFSSNADVMRKKIISLLASMEGYESQSFKYEFIDPASNKIKMGSNGIYLFVRKIGYAKKELNEYTIKELPKLVTQFEQLRKNVWDAQANKAVAELKTMMA